MANLNKIKHFLVVLLLIGGCFDVYYHITYAHIPSFINYGHVPRISELGYMLNDLFRYWATICTFLGGYIYWKSADKAFNGFLKYPLFLDVSIFMVSFLFNLMSLELPFPNFEGWSIHILNYVLYITTIFLGVYYFIQQPQNRTQSSYIACGRWQRLFNYMWDRLHLLVICFIHIRLLEDWVFKDVWFLNNNPYGIGFIMMFVYYFVFESVFGQTIGKLSTGNYVAFPDEASRIKVTLIRTLCRFIPFNVISIFRMEKVPWHDQLSNTIVGVKGVEEFDLADIQPLKVDEL